MNHRLGLVHNKKKVGMLLRLYRQSKKYKSEFVAKKLSISEANYSKLENGKIELTDTRLFLVCKIYEITPPEFICILSIDTETAVSKRTSLLLLINTFQILFVLLITLLPSFFKSNLLT